MGDVVYTLRPTPAWPTPPPSRQSRQSLHRCQHNDTRQIGSSSADQEKMNEINGLAYAVNAFLYRRFRQCRIWSEMSYPQVIHRLVRLCTTSSYTDLHRHPNALPQIHQHTDDITVSYANANPFSLAWPRAHTRTYAYAYASTRTRSNIHTIVQRSMKALGKTRCL